MWMRICPVAVGALLVAGCSGESAEPRQSGSTSALDSSPSYPTLAPPAARRELLDAADLGDGFEIEPHRPGRCSFDNRSQVARLSPDGTVQWTVDVPWTDFSSLITIGAVAVGRFSEGERDGLYAVDLMDGSPVWQRFIYDGRISDYTLVGDGVAIHTDRGERNDSDLALIDPSTGEVRWRVEVEEFIRLVGVDDVAVVADLVGDKITAYRDVSTAWEVPSEGDSATLHLLGDMLIVGSYPSRITRHDPATGGELWRWVEGDPLKAASVVGVVDGLIVLDVHLRFDPARETQPEQLPHGIVVLDAATGNQVWSREGGEIRLLGNTLISEDRPTGRGQVISLTTGEPLWDFAPGTYLMAGDADLVTRKERGWGSERSVLARAADGAELWRLDTPGRLSSVSRTAEGILLGTTASDSSSVITDDPGGELIALSADGAEVRWRASFRDPIGQPPLLLDGGDLLVRSADPSTFCD